MTGYTKLFNSLVASTVWREPDHVRIVWITMLAMKDQYHIVEASVPGLADLARVPLDKCVEALEALQAPDPWSRSKAHEGRRIKEVDGGWLILNGSNYQDKMDVIERRAKDRRRQADRRARLRKMEDEGETVTAPRNGQPLPGERAYLDAMKRGDEKAANQILESSLPQCDEPAGLI